MRQYIGSLVASLVGVAIAIVGAATHWPWPWWVWLIVIALCFVAAVLALPARAASPPSTAFVAGDGSGSTFRNVYSDADNFVRGDARHALFWNVVHRSRQNKS